MKNLLFPLALIPMLFLSCGKKLTDDHDHGHIHEAEALSYTLYTDKSELFVEFKPLVAGQETRFAAHFTLLGEYFNPLTEGQVILSLDQNGKRTSVKAEGPSSPGIFRLSLEPETSGMGKLIFDIQAGNFSDKIFLDSIMVFENENAVLESALPSGPEGEITYLKEQAWKVEFANAELKKQVFHEVIKASGMIISAPGDEMIVTAKAKGIVLFSENAIPGSAAKEGSGLFTIAGGDITDGNIDVAYKEAKARLDKAKADYDRAKELIKEKIISEKEFLRMQMEFGNAELNFTSLAKNYSVNGQAVNSPMDGFVKNIMVSEGQFVEAGAPIASISGNKRLILQAQVSQRYFEKLPFIRSANFKTAGSDTILSTEDMNGKVVVFAKSISGSSPFISLSFEIDNTGNLIPGSVAEVYLKAQPVQDALVLPVTSLIEEQGNFFIYVQTAGESFQKRQVKIGGSDGKNVQLLNGAAEGERVVTKGAYQIKLATAGGALPAHGHEH